jgi:hypothetical protein
MADGSIAGTVTNAINGAKMEGVEVSLRNTSTGQTSTTETDVDGKFSFDPLPAGNYTLTASKTGFSSYVDSDLSPTIADFPILMLKKGISV